MRLEIGEKVMHEIGEFCMGLENDARDWRILAETLVHMRLERILHEIGEFYMRWVSDFCCMAI